MSARAIFSVFTVVLCWFVTTTTCACAELSPAAIKGAVETSASSAESKTQSAQNVPDFIRVPVFYVTDRNRVGKGSRVEFGKERKYRGFCPHDCFVGVAYCTIENTEHRALPGFAENIEWKNTARHTEGPDGIDLFEGGTYADQCARLFDNIHKDTVATPDKEFYIFVPGYMSTFESGLRSAARIGYFAQRPVLLYSWPSKGKFTEYWADESTVEWSQDHFNQMIRDITDLGTREEPVHARLYAHSMGGRLILRGIPFLRANPTMREVSVICPDVDDGVVKHYAQKYFDGKSQCVVRLYLSKADEMLRLSRFVHGGYARFGEDSAPLDELVPRGASISLPAGAVGDAAAANTSLGNGGQASAQVAGKPFLRRLQTIDFTALDIGTFGHRIPVEVLTSLSQRGEAGDGLRLVLKKPSESFAEAGKKEKADLNSEHDPADGVLAVVRTNGWKAFPVTRTVLKYRPRLHLWLTKDWTLK